MRFTLLTLFLLALPMTAQASEEVIKEIATAEITCTTTPTPLRTSISIQKDRDLVMTVPETATQSVFVGSSKVTKDNGLEVGIGGSYSTNKKLRKGVIQYCVVASGSVKVRIQESTSEVSD